MKNSLLGDEFGHRRRLIEGFAPAARGKVA
jgi:hypothetical protein